MKSKVILFNINIFKKLQIEGICKKLGIDVINASPADRGKTLDEIAAGIGKTATDESFGFSEEMILLCGLLPDTLDKLLDEMKNANMGQNELKAVLTKYNAKWTPVMLRNELIKERDFLKK